MVIAKNSDELHSQLRILNIKVRPRAKGRRKDHVETYAIVRLLATLPRAPCDFPVRLTKRERPDFLIQFGARAVGVEHTEAISENAAKEAFLRSQGNGPDVYFVRRSPIHEPRKSRKQLIEEIEADDPGPGWAGDSIERDWAAAMTHFISQKVTNASCTGFDLFEENWLLVYDNWTAPALKREHALKLLRVELKAADPWTVYDRIFVLDEKVLLEIASDTSLFYYVNDCTS